MTSEDAEIYRTCKIAMLTGWTFEHIESLGMYNSEALLQVYEAEQKLKNQPPKKGKRR